MTAAGTEASGELFREATREIYDAALRRALDGPRHDLVRPLLRGRFGALPRTVDHAVDECLRDAARDLMLRGWRPLELLAFLSRRLDESGVAYGRDTLAAAAQWNAATDWLADLETADARVWWSVGEPHVRQWSERHGVRRADTVRIAVEVLALVAFLPRTDFRLPGGPDAAPVAPGSVVQDPRIIGRIDALLARAASTSFTDEARACAIKAQQLMVRYATVPTPPAAATVVATIATDALRTLVTEGPLGTARALFDLRRLASFAGLFTRRPDRSAPLALPPPPR